MWVYDQYVLVVTHAFHSNSNVQYIPMEAMIWYDGDEKHHFMAILIIYKSK